MMRRRLNLSIGFSCLLTGAILAFLILLGYDGQAWFRFLDSLFLSGSPIWLFAVALLEGTFVVGFMVPGSGVMLVVLTSLACSWSGPPAALIAIWLGTLGGNILSYILGKIFRTSLRLKDAAPPFSSWLALSGLHPNMASTAMYHAGAEGRPFVPLTIWIGLFGAVALIVYSRALCEFKGFVYEYANGIGWGWVGYLIVYGIWDIYKALKDPPQH